MFDPNTGEFSEGGFALDTHSALAGDTSIFDSLANVVTKGIPLTGLSIVNSFANTGIQVANFFGAGLDQWSIDKEMESQGWDDYANYYKDHQEGIEAAGLLVGGLIPGMAAVKALKLAQAGKMTSVLQRATGIFSTPRTSIMENAVKDMADKGSLFNSLASDKVKAVALGFGDQALQALVFETAVAGTMKASPLLNDMDMSDVVSNMFYGALIGGGIGGVVEGIGTNAFLNRAKLNVDSSTKAAQISNRAGFLGNSTVNDSSIAADRVITLLDSIDKIPASGGNALFSKTAAATRDSAILAAKKELQNLVPKGEEDLANSAFDTIFKAYQTGDKETAYDHLAQLVKISRVDTPASVPVGDAFYIPRTSAPGVARTLDDLGSTAPLNIPGQIEQRYQLAPYAQSKDVRIIHEGDFPPSLYDDLHPMFTSDALFTTEQKEALDLLRTPGVPFKTSAEAFGNGADVFINAKGGVVINSGSETLLQKIARPGESRVLTLAEEKLRGNEGQLTKSLPDSSKPLYSTPVILRTTDGSVLTKAVPVIGDYGKPEVNARGLQAGSKFSPQTLATPLTVETETLDANARYVWAAQRGIKNGDKIIPTDIPMMEQLWRDYAQSGKQYPEWLGQMERRGVTISEESLPRNPNDLLNEIRSHKDNLIQELMTTDSSLSSEEIARRANVPESYLSNQFGATKASDYMIDPAQSAVVNHLQLEYDIGNIYQQDGNILRGLLSAQYRINLIKDAAEVAHAEFFGTTANNFSFGRYTSKDATVAGTGPGFFTFSNSNYGTIGQAAERIGRFFTNWTNDRQSVVARTLTPAAMGLRSDPVAAAEASMFTAVRRRTGEAFTFLPDDLAAKYGVNPGQSRAVLTSSLVKDKGGNIVDWNPNFTPPNYLPGVFEVNQGGELQTGNLHTYYDLSPKVAAWERANLDLNDTRLTQLNKWYAAQGIQKNIQTGNLYAPPIDTSKTPFFAFIKARAGTAMSDDGVAVITANDAKSLEEKIASLRDDYSVYTKDMLKDYHQVQGDYDYSRNFAQSRVNNDLRRRGLLNDVYPPTNAETLISDMNSFNNRQEIRQGRDFIELGNAQLFAELRAMGDRFVGAERSQTGYVSAAAGRQSDNPYNSYIRTALGLNDKDTYTLWANAQEKLEAFGDTAFNMARSLFRKAKDGVISYEDASAMAEKFGMGNPYAAATYAASTYYNIANKLPPARLLSRFVSTANTILASATIRLDAFQSLINIVSSPILMSAEFNSAKTAITSGAINGSNVSTSPLTDLLSTELPNSGGRLLPSSTKATFKAVSNWFDSSVREQWLPVYKQMGIVRESSSEYFKMIDALTLPYGRGVEESMIVKKLSDAADFGSKVSGSQYSENFVRFVAADVARQLFSAAGKEGTELLDNIGTFVNRVHGNYIGSQRPVAFQGPLGSAMSLFQTYQFNLMQQLFRYVENGEGKSLAILSGLQSTIFGMQGLPGFQMINNHLVGNAAGNPAHKDIYSATANLLDPKLGNYLMYGIASNWMQSGLYSRGDINPRQISVLPLNPLDFPAISGGINFISNLLDTTDKIVKGGDISASLLLGLEHNGINRPLAGLGQLMQGFVTNTKGNLVAATAGSQGAQNFGATSVDPDDPMKHTGGWSDMVAIANFSRLMGARPLDEAIAMDAMYRKTTYIAKDTTRIQDLGEAAKTYLYAGGVAPEAAVQSFAAKYASSGGYAPRFGQEMMKWTNDANVSVANQIFRSLQKPVNQEMMKQMGGVPLPDFSLSGSIAGSSTQGSSGVR